MYLEPGTVDQWEIQSSDTYVAEKTKIIRTELKKLHCRLDNARLKNIHDHDGGDYYSESK